MKPRFWERRVDGVKFVFKSDPADRSIMHIYARRLKEPEDAIYIWFNGTEEVWNDKRRRFETFTEDEGLY